MKKNFLDRSRFFVSVAAIAIAGVLVLPSCDDDDDDMKPPSAKYNLSGSASGAQEVPAVTTTASGTLSGSYDTVSKSLIYSVNWTGLSGDATMAHFHGPALAGEVAPPIETLTITTNGMAGTATDTVTASAALHTALVAGKVYYNVHTAINPDGEIRGHVNLAQ
ncbi:MAG TPA: CHRD domain-containing protein [Chitinophagaceae bacterium]|nr:CHRD domain-containing protein [Chitinophagaceae bacterium]